MKNLIKTFIAFILMLMMLPMSAGAQMRDNFTNDAMLMSDNGMVAVIRSSGIHKKKKEAVQMAVLSAFDTYFFSGIDGLNDGKPVIGDNMTKAQKYYVQRIMNEGRYVQFVTDIKEVGDSPVKLPNKMYKATVEFTLYLNALQRDMIRSKVMARPKTVAETVEDMPKFTLTIVPFKQENETYGEVLRGNDDVRPVIAIIENSLKQKGYEIKDFLAVVDAAERNAQFEMDRTAVSNDNILINQTQADVYVTVDLQEVTDDNGGEGVVALKAYEVSTGNILGSDFARSRHYRNYSTVALYERAIEQCLDRFVTNITSGWSKKNTEGQMYTVRFSISPESMTDMTQEVGIEALPLSSVLTQWIKDNSLNHRYHLLGYSDEGIFFDQIFIKDGEELEFSNKLYRYLRDELELNSNCRKSGNTYYITIE